jgi:SAM-dependent methyltransferase
VRGKDTVIDIGAGYCEFINTILCGRKIAVDLNTDTKDFASKDVEVVTSSALKIPEKYNAKIDVVFMSNFLEHLESKQEVIKVLRKANQLLKVGGKILLIQPNINLVKERYWDFIDHTIPLNTNSMKEALHITGFEITTLTVRFLPYTTKSFQEGRVFPSWIKLLLLKIYLRIPPFMRLYAGQTFLCAVKTNNDSNIQ